MKLRKLGLILVPLVVVGAFLLVCAPPTWRALLSTSHADMRGMVRTAQNVWPAIKVGTVNHFTDPGTIRKYLESHAVRKLQLGAGGNDPEGWLNSDIFPAPKEIYIDAAKRFPVPDGSFQYVFSEHVIEHVSWEDGVAMLRECHRVLAPGGKVRTVTPNLAKFCHLLESTDGPGDQPYIATKLRLHGWGVTPVPGAEILNRENRYFGHQFLYDPAALRKSLELAGFQQIAEYQVGEKTDPVFQEAEFRTRNQGSDVWVVNNWEAMALEATR